MTAPWHIPGQFITWNPIAMTLREAAPVLRRDKETGKGDTSDEGSNIVLSQARLLSNVSMFHAPQGQAISWMLAKVHSEMSVGKNYIRSESFHRHQRR